MKASFYAGSVNAAAWNKARLLFFFLVGCVFAGNVFRQIHEINPTGKFPKRAWNLWKASAVHEQSKYWQMNIGVLSLIETGKEQYIARKAIFKLVSECNWKNTFFNLPNVHV